MQGFWSEVIANVCVNGKCEGVWIEDDANILFSSERNPDGSKIYQTIWVNGEARAMNGRYCKI